MRRARIWMWTLSLTVFLVAVTNGKVSAEEQQQDLVSLWLQMRYVAVAKIVAVDARSSEPARLRLRLEDVLAGVVRDSAFTVIGLTPSSFSRPGLSVGATVVARSPFAAQTDPGAPGNVLLVSSDGALHTEGLGLEMIPTVDGVPVTEAGSLSRIRRRLADRAMEHPSEWIRSGQSVRWVTVTAVKGPPPYALDLVDIGGVVGQVGVGQRSRIWLRPKSPCRYQPNVGDTLLLPVADSSAMHSDTVEVCLKELTVRGGRLPLFGTPVAAVRNHFQMRDGRLRLSGVHVRSEEVQHE